MKSIGSYGGYVVGCSKSLSGLSPMCNNSSKRFNGRICRAFYQESEVSCFYLLAHENNQASLVCDDVNLFASLMTFDRNDYFNEDRAI